MDAGLTLSVHSSESGTDTEDLLEWLRDEPELRSVVQRIWRRPEPGHMGGLAEILIASVSAGGVLTVLAASLRSWLTRDRQRSVELCIRTEAGFELEVKAEHADDLRRLIRDLANQ
jgi:hypothetical protein